NAQKNQVRVHACLPDDFGPGQFDVVVANILSNPLMVLAPMLSNRVAPGGSLVLSGILERQADAVAQAYAPWLKMQVWQARDGWVCLHGQRDAVSCADEAHMETTNRRTACGSLVPVFTTTRHLR